VYYVNLLSIAPAIVLGLVFQACSIQHPTPNTPSNMPHATRHADAMRHAPSVTVRIVTLRPAPIGRCAAVSHSGAVWLAGVERDTASGDVD
jgi:hypothetical protein